MYFDSFADLIAMGSHGPYVWSAYALTLLVIIVNFVAIVHRRKQTISTIRQKLRRQQLQEDDSSEPQA